MSGAPLAVERSGLSGKDLLVAWPLRERTGMGLSWGVGGEEDMGGEGMKQKGICGWWLTLYSLVAEMAESQIMITR